jgi:hypothetical protein
MGELMVEGVAFHCWPSKYAPDVFAFTRSNTDWTVHIRRLQGVHGIIPTYEAGRRLANRAVAYWDPIVQDGDSYLDRYGGGSGWNTEVTWHELTDEGRRVLLEMIYHINPEFRPAKNEQAMWMRPTWPTWQARFP